MKDDIFFEADEEDTSVQPESDNWIMFDDEEEAVITEETPKETAEIISEEVIPEVSEPAKLEEEDEEIDLDWIFGDMEETIGDAQASLDKISEDPSTAPVEVKLLKDTISKLSSQLEKVNKEKLDFQFRAAELEAFGVESIDPKIMSLSRNFAKYKDGDDAAKDKAIKLAKDIIFDLTWEDFDATKVSSDVDLLTQAELYNNAINPNLKASKEEEDGIAL